MGKAGAVLAGIGQQPERWFLWSPVALASGIAAYFALPLEPPGLLFLILAGGGLGLALLARRGLGLPASLALCLVFAGFVLAKARTEAVRAPAIERRMGPVEVVGVIADADPARRRQMRLVVQVEAVQGLAASETPRKLVLMVPGAEGLSPGARIAVPAMLSPLLTPVIPGGFDGARAQWFAQIGGTGFARQAPQVTGQAAGFGSFIARLRAGMGARIGAVLQGDAGAFAEAIITGERSRLSDAATEQMQISGLAHIISISGLHMSLVAGGVFWCVRALLAMAPALALYHPIKKYAAVAGILAGALYTLLSGAQVAALRSFLMLGVMFAAVLFDRPALSMRNVALSALLIELFMPEAVLSASFQMSFLAVTGLIAMHEMVPPPAGEPRLARRVQRVLLLAAATSLVAGLFSGIPAAYHFNRLSPYSLLANLIAAPLVSFLVMPMALVAALLMPLGLEAWSLGLLGLGLAGVLAIADWVAGLPGAAQLIPSPSLAGVLLIALGALWASLWKGSLRGWGLVLVIAGLAVSGWRERPDILVERTARNAAVRLADGSLAFANPRRGRFAAEKWMASEADDAPLAEAAKRGWNCEGFTCEVQVKGRRVLFLNEGAKPECGVGDVVIADFPLRGMCRQAALRIDRIDVWRSGAHAVTITPSGLQVETAQGARGARPWVIGVKPRLKPQ